MRFTATRTVAGRALRCPFGGHVRGEFPVRAWRVGSRLSFFLHWPTHHHPHPHLMLISTTTGHFTIVQPVRVAVITNGFVPKTMSSSYFRANLLGSSQRPSHADALGFKPAEKKRHTHLIHPYHTKSIHET